MKTLSLSLVIAAAFGLSACQRSADNVPKPQAAGPTATTPADAAAITAGPKTDPSVPSAGATVGTAPNAAGTPGQDSAANPPLSTLNKQEEKEEMPKALQGNNHSSPNVGTATKP